MKKYLLVFLACGFLGQAQNKPVISKAEVVRIETELASDKMQGRKVFTAGIDSASVFIEKEFAKIGLDYYKGLNSYRQEFKGKGKAANNVIGVLKGKSKPEEFVVFSAHYDHLGTISGSNDTIYNGANDDASGTTAVIALAQYFKELNQNERTIIFVAFTAEEVGGYGSGYFSKNINPEQVVAMFNIEMIGTESKWNKNSAYITGFEKSDFGTILQKNLKGTDFNFYPDPYPTEQLFYRSDNARLAAVGVPAHTISTSKMDSEPNYHQLSDEVSTLDLDNMTEIIKAIALSSESIINGKDTPKRIEKLPRN
ncbi:M20/M25/M40 family metallo-hydrolase [Flavobacterium sp. J49]|uniref:M20/M25/M40 family metallo-hydrolase n=1 Tax=Flavobacterium sp. J49 TaxID=2718534 RepID=UPI001593C9BB|nr:M20/M25/M40 family metallo-hydrolase [Flavobacterium sp. J49]MBF6641901.1 M20/M25/M40 family metallo-hydrolase [Flavobacterium sp. J49]NIC03148.1 M20/M25/M40 family metallo-hydrolase [Flavobacterium sp. J49]